MSDGEQEPEPEIRFRLIDGDVYVSMIDLTHFLRVRRGAYAIACNASEVVEHSTAYRTVATELDRMADMLDTQAIALLTSQ